MSSNVIECHQMSPNLTNHRMPPNGKISIEGATLSLETSDLCCHLGDFGHHLAQLCQARPPEDAITKFTASAWHSLEPSQLRCIRMIVLISGGVCIVQCMSTSLFVLFVAPLCYMSKVQSGPLQPHPPIRSARQLPSPRAQRTRTHV